MGAAQCTPLEGEGQPLCPSTALGQPALQEELQECRFHCSLTALHTSSQLISATGWEMPQLHQHWEQAVSPQAAPAAHGSSAGGAAQSRLWLRAVV